jgi:NodT family efflux transporter outer membrane factor (OMF) lipoprotein
LRQSEAARRAGDAIFFPTLGGDFGATRQLSTPLKLGGAGPGGLFNLYTLSGTVGYALDIFGGQRRTAEALTAAVDYQRMVARATDITLISSVINASVALAGYREQIDASQAILSDYQALVDLTTAQVKAGATSEAALLELRSQLSSQQITLSAIARQAAATEHLLSTLIGREPGADAPNAPELIALSEPGVLPLTVPSTLVRQRPDILAAEAQWHIASADVGITTAALFPTLTLSGTLGQDSTHWPGFSGAEGKFWTGGADISLPLYSGGRSWFGRKAALEAYQAAASDYRQTVLAGLAQVADVLSALNQDHLALTAARDSEASMALTLRLVDVTSRTGASSEASRLYADIAAQSARSNRIGAQARYLQDIVALYVALGGGWWADARISNGKKAP